MPLPDVPLPIQDYELNLPSGYLSWSQISLYLECGEKYRRRYIEGIEEPKSIYPVEGTILGRVLEESGKQYVAKKKHFTLNQALGHHSAVCTCELDQVAQWHGQQPDDVIARGASFIRKLWGDGGPPLAPIRMPDGKPGVEYPVSLEIAGVKVVGIADLVEAGQVMDYKVVGSYSAKMLDIDRSMQLGFYAAALGVPRVGYILFNKDTGDITPKYARRDATTYRRWLEQTVAHVAKGISQGVFPPCLPEKNSLCGKKWCHHYGDCYGLHG